MVLQRSGTIFASMDNERASCRPAELRSATRSRSFMAYSFAAGSCGFSLRADKGRRQSPRTLASAGLLLFQRDAPAEHRAPTRPRLQLDLTPESRGTDAEVVEPAPAAGARLDTAAVVGDRDEQLTVTGEHRHLDVSRLRVTGHVAQ